jgi:hypothetical protein
MPTLLQYGMNLDGENQGVRCLYPLTAVDDPVTATGTTAANAYQITAGTTRFTTVAVGTGAVLPETSGVPKLQGAEFWIINSGANYLTIYPNIGDVGATINGLSSVVLQPNSITPFRCSATGLWYCDGIGAGFAGAIETIASQGSVAAAGTSQGTATPITQAVVNFTSGGGTPAGGTLPVAKAGLQITVGANTGSNITIYGNGSDTINTSTAGATGVAQTNATITIYVCATNGNWLTK